MNFPPILAPLLPVALILALCWIARLDYRRRIAQILDRLIELYGPTQPWPAPREDDWVHGPSWEPDHGPWLPPLPWTRVA